MQKKLTISRDEDVYAGLYQIVGRRKISRFIESLSGPTSYVPMFGKATGGWRRIRNEKSRLWNG